MFEEKVKDYNPPNAIRDVAPMTFWLFADFADFADFNFNIFLYSAFSALDAIG